MKNNTVFAVTSFSSYENGEIFFGLENLFATKEEAVQHIRARMNEELANYDSDGFAVDYEIFRITDSTHCFRWELRECVLPESQKNC